MSIKRIYLLFCLLNLFINNFITSFKEKINNVNFQKYLQKKMFELEINKKLKFQRKKLQLELIYLNSSINIHGMNRIQKLYRKNLNNSCFFENFDKKNKFIAKL